MPRNRVALSLIFASIWPGLCGAWDPVGDIRNPGRIIRNIGREVGNAGAQIDRLRIEAQANAAAPAFEAWLHQSRANAASGAQPMPVAIRQALSGFYPEDILNRARFKIGDGGVFNLAQLSIRYGGASAVTLIDIIVFRDQNQAFNDPILWAHELKHVQQFRDWGVRNFAVRYLRSWNSVENEAYAAQNAFAARWTQAQNLPPPPSWPPAASNLPAQSIPASVAAVCATPFGYCPMAVAIPIGSQCYCPAPNGPIWGFAR